MAELLSHLPAEARCWVYGAERNFTETEKAHISDTLQGFVKSWAAHGSVLSADFQLVEDRFIVLAVDESSAGASGCSIDSSVKVLRTLEHELGLSLLENGFAYYEGPSGIERVAATEMKAAIESGHIKPQTLLFGVHANRLDALRENWRKPAVETWMGRFYASTIA